jgi:hypothetical protein
LSLLEEVAVAPRAIVDHKGSEGTDGAGSEDVLVMPFSGPRRRVMRISHHGRRRRSGFELGSCDVGARRDIQRACLSLCSARYKSTWMFFGRVARPEAAPQKTMRDHNQEARLAWYEI